MPDEYLSLQEAAELMGVSRFKLWRLLKEGKLTAYQSERDRREKLVSRREVEALIRPTPIAKKVAA